MDDAAYCAVGCPPNKTCRWPTRISAASSVHRGHTILVRRVAVKLMAMTFSSRQSATWNGNQPHIVQQNQGTLELRQALYVLVQAIDIPQGPSLFRSDDGALSFPRPPYAIQGLTTNMIDDLVRLLHNMVPDSEFEVELQIADIERQPRSWRANRRNYFAVHPTHAQRLPHNALNLAPNEPKKMGFARHRIQSGLAHPECFSESLSDAHRKQTQKSE